MIEERWKSVVGYEGMYRVSDRGTVESIEREALASNATKSYRIRGKVLKHRVNPHGYCIVGISSRGVHSTVYVHRLVAAAFIENVSDKPQVNHIDGNKQNNHVSNLEWNTASENLTHCLGKGLRVMPRGEEHWKNRGIKEMKTSDQKKFYAAVGKVLTQEMKRRNLTVSGLSSRTGEHHNTIRALMEGRGQASLHHAVWLKKNLGINLTDIIMEGDTHGNEEKSSDNTIKTYPGVRGLDVLL